MRAKMTKSAALIGKDNKIPFKWLPTEVTSVHQKDRHLSWEQMRVFQNKKKQNYQDVKRSLDLFWMENKDSHCNEKKEFSAHLLWRQISTSYNLYWSRSHVSLRPSDCSLPGSSVQGILQARLLRG